MRDLLCLELQNTIEPVCDQRDTDKERQEKRYINPGIRKERNTLDGRSRPRPLSTCRGSVG